MRTPSSPTPKGPASDQTSEGGSQTLVTTVSVDGSSMIAQAIYLDREFDLETIRRSFVEPKPELRPTTMVESHGGYAVFLPFGAVVFWATSEESLVKITMAVGEKIGLSSGAIKAQDKLMIRLQKEEDRVNFKDVWLRQLTLEHIKLISETLGQSTALEDCEKTVQSAIANGNPSVQQLKTLGAIRDSSKGLLKLVGFTLAMRETLLSKLALIDDPPEAWQSERLAQLHGQLYDHFDLHPRLASIDTKLEYLSDLNETLMDVLQHRESHRLEWIVIFLIVIEVLFSCIHFFESR